MPPLSFSEVDLLFNGYKKDRLTVSREWLLKLDSIVVMKPAHSIESFRLSCCCGKYDYTEFKSNSNKITEDMKNLFANAPAPCKFFLGWFKIRDGTGGMARTRFDDYIITMRTDPKKYKVDK